MPQPYLASALPDHEVAELHRLMSEEIREVAVFFMDIKGTITVWNRAAEVMKGYTAEEAIGSPLALLYTDADNARSWWRHNLEEARKHGFYKEEGWRKRKDGSLFWARIALTALHDQGGGLVGFSNVTVDLTEHKRLERCIKEREQTRRILRAANAGTWTWHPEADRVDVCVNFLQLLGQPLERTHMSLHEWLQLVDPRDRPQLSQRFAAARAARVGAPLVAEARLCHKDGSGRWFYLHADWDRSDDGELRVLSGVNVGIQDVKAAGEELRMAVDKLREADARKDEFLAMLAHELRNPLAPIRSAAELLRLARLDQAQVQKTSEIIARQVGHLTSLVDDLLDVSRVTRGLVKLQLERLDMRQVVTDAVEQVNPLLRARRHHLALHLEPHAAVVRGDKKRLVQVVSNLLNNAAKYTPEGGHIRVDSRVEQASVVVSVSDDGIGMEAAVASRVFELFTQAERTPDRSAGGLGVGLALVRSLVDLHGGTVQCESAGPRQGSRFTVWLPLEAIVDAPPENCPVGKVCGGQKALRILVVDDNADAAHMLAMFLEAWGHRVLVEHGPQQALERARLDVPDVCLLDIGLPGMDGNELARRLREQPETRHATLIAVTGYGQERDRSRAVAAGFRHHLVKPVDPAQLLALLGDAENARSP